MPRSPLVVIVARLIGALLLGRSLLVFTLSLRAGNHLVLLARYAWPVWSELVLASIVAVSLALSYQRGKIGMISSAIPVGVWLILTMLSPESWTAWHWLVIHGPAEPPWLPFEFSYRFRYRSYEQLVGSCWMVVAQEVVFPFVLFRLIYHSRSRAYFFGNSTAIPETAA